MKNYKTTLCGVISAIGAGFTQSPNPTLQAIGQLLTPLGLALTGWFASDAGSDKQ